MEKRFLLWKSLFSIIIPAVFFYSCSRDFSFKSDKEKSQSVSVLTWNLQTFFDGKKDGCEYDQFLSERYWNKELYEKRLKRLAEVLKKLDCDIVVMEEIENEEVLYDLYNFLSGEWDKSKVFKWASFAKSPFDATGCAVLSRLALENVKLHSLDIQSEGFNQPSMRPLLEVEVKNKKGNITLIANHWKSMRGGKEESEKWRNRQESLLCNIIENCNKKNNYFIALGDFNRDFTDFMQDSKNKKVLLRRYENLMQTEEGILVKSVWHNYDSDFEGGSYYYKNEWSCIDNIFYSDNLTLDYFDVEKNGPWCDKKTSVPYGFTLWNGSGYSDHLPLKAVFSF